MCEVASVRLSLRLDEGEEGGGVRGKERGRGMSAAPAMVGERDGR